MALIDVARALSNAMEMLALCDCGAMMRWVDLRAERERKAADGG